MKWGSYSGFQHDGQEQREDTPPLKEKRERNDGRQEEIKKPVLSLRIPKRDLDSPNKTRHLLAGKDNSQGIPFVRITASLP